MQRSFAINYEFRPLAGRVLAVLRAASARRVPTSCSIQTVVLPFISEAALLLP
jgi:hypothetical protein